MVLSKQILVLSISIFLLISVHSCNRNNNKEITWKGGAIEKYGKYNYNSGLFIVDVYEKKNILQYKCKYRFSDSFVSKERASTYQNWILYYDTTKNDFWVYSSDIGFFKWTFNVENKKFEEVTITPSTGYLVRNIPESLFDKLPIVSQKFCLQNGYIVK